MSHPLDDDPTPAPEPVDGQAVDGQAVGGQAGGGQSVATSGVAQAAMGGLPQFGIIHLFLLTAACSLLLIPSRQLLGQDFSNTPNLRWLFIVQWFMHIAFHAGPLTALFMWLPCYLRRERFPVAPGHWLLIVMGVAAVTSVLTSLIWVVLRIQDLDWGEQSLTAIIYFGTGIVFSALRIMATLLVAWRGVKETRWRFGFASIVVVEFLALITFVTLLGGVNWGYFVIQYVKSAAHLAAFCAISASAIIDLKIEKRDWLHWFGVLCYLLSGLVATAFNILYQFVYA